MAARNSRTQATSSSTAKRIHRPSFVLSPLVAALLASVAMPVDAGPTGGVVVDGSAHIKQTPNTTVVTETSNSAIINWQSFSIAPNELVRFIQPSSNSVVLNRVVGGDPSNIFGDLEANGKVFLINPNGALFAPGAQINVAALIASTLDISNADFMSGHYNFSGSSTASVVNQGNIQTSKGGYVALMARNVDNSGTITSPSGSVVLAAGQKVALSIAGDGLLNVAVDGAALNALASNSGNIVANGGKVVLSASAMNTVLQNVVNQSGVIEAQSVGTQNGVVVLNGGATGVVSVSGTIDASGKAAGQTGGKVDITGDDVGVFSGALVDVSGAAGGGAVRIGGGSRGLSTDISNANAVYFDPNATVHADALQSGNGGSITLYSLASTKAYGTLSSTGGMSGGNGGSIETSGAYLDVAGITIKTASAKGTGGQWLLDPEEVVIGDANSSTPVNVTTGEQTSGTNPVIFTPNNGTAHIKNTDIDAQLNAGTSVTIVTTDAGTQGALPGDILVEASILKSAGPANTPVTLTLQANANVEIGAGGTGVVIGSSSGKLNVVLDAFTAGALPNTTAGSVTMQGASSIYTNGGFIAIGGGALSGGLPSGAAIGPDHGVDIQGGALDTRTGVLNTISNNLPVLNTTGIGSTGGGSITINGQKTTILLAGPGQEIGDAGVNFEVTSQGTANLASGDVPAINTGGGNVTIIGSYTGAQSLSQSSDVGNNFGTASIYLNGLFNLGAGNLVLNGNGGTTNAGVFLAQDPFNASNPARFANDSIVANTITVSVNGTNAGAGGAPFHIGSSITDTSLNIAMTGGGTTDQSVALVSNQVTGNGVGSTFNLSDNTNKVRQISGTAGSFDLVTANNSGGALPLVGVTISNMVLTGNLIVSADGPVSSQGTNSAGGNASFITAKSSTGTQYNITLSGGTTFDFGGVSLVGGVVTDEALTLLAVNNLNATGNANFVVDNGPFTASFGPGQGFTVGGTLNISALGANGNLTVLDPIASGSSMTLDSSHSVTIADNAALTAGATGTPANVSITGLGSTAAGQAAIAIGAGAPITNFGGNVTLDGQGSSGAGVTIGANSTIGASGANNVAITATTQSGASAISLGADISGSGALTFNTANTVGMSNASGVFNLSKAELDMIQPGFSSISVSTSNTSAAALVYGDTTVANDDYSFNAPLNLAAAGAVTLQGSLDFLGGNVPFSSRNLTVAGTSLTQTAGQVTANDVTVTVPGAVVLNSTGNAIGTFGTAAPAASLNFVNGQDIDENAYGIAVNGAATLNAGNNNINLSAANNYLEGTTNIVGAEVTLINNTLLTLGNVSVLDDLNVTSVGAGVLNLGTGTIGGNLTAVSTLGSITQAAGGISVGGTSLFDASGDEGTITLASAANTLTGNITVTGGATTIDNTVATVFTSENTSALNVSATSGNIEFGPGTIGGNLVATAATTITQSAAIAVAGTSTLVAPGGIDLSQPSNTFGGGVNATATAGNIEISATGPLTISQALAGGSATVLDTSDTVTIPGAISVGTDFNLTAQGLDLAGGSINSTGGAGNLVIRQLAGETMELGGATPPGTPTFEITSAELAAITGFASYDFGADAGGLLSVGAGGAVLGGPLTLRSGAGIAIDGPVSANGGASLLTLRALNASSVTEAGTGGITGSQVLLDGNGVFLLNNTGTNQVPVIGATGTVSELDLNDATTGTLQLGYSTFPLMVGAGGLTVITAGALTEAAPNPVTVAGTTSLTAASVALPLQNAFTGSVTVNAGVTTITNSIPLTAILDTTGTTNLLANNTTSGSDQGVTVSGTVSGSDLNVTGSTVSFGTTTVDGALDTIASGAVSQTGPVTVGGMTTIAAAGQTITLNNTSNVLTGAVNLTGAVTSVDDSVALTAHLTTSGLTNLTSEGQNLFVDGTVSNGNLNTTGGATSFGATTVAAGNLDAIATGAVTQTGAVSVSGSSVIAAGANPITLTNAGNVFTGPVSLTGGTTSLVDSVALNATILTSGVTTLNAGANALTVTGSASGPASNLNTTGGVTTFGTTSVGGNLSTVASGAVSQTGPLTVAGTSTIAAAGQPITLTNTGNILTGAVNLTGAVTSVDDSVALTAHLTTSGLTNLTSEGQNLFVDGTVSNGNLNTTGGATSFGATSVAAGNLDAIASGAVTQTGAVSVSGSSVIAAGANPITLTNAGNVFTGPVSLTGGTTSLVDSVALNATILTSGVTTLNAGANALTVTGSTTGALSNLNTTGGVTTFGTTSVGGNLSTVAGGAVTQTGPLTVAGTSTIAAAGQPITLTNTGNILTGAVNLTGAVTSVDDSVALTAHLTTSGTTNLTSEGQNLFVDGTVSAGNLNTTGGATSFGATTVSTGNLDAIATGAVTQTGAVSVSGSSVIAAGANPITLTNAGNVFTGPVSLTGGTTSLVDSVALNATILTSGVTTLNAGANALTVTGSTTGALSNLNTTGGVTTFGTTSVGGNLSTVAGGAVTQTGPLTVAGTSTIAAAGQPITLTNTGNILTGAVNLTGAVTSVDDSVALTAHLTTSGTTNLTSEGQNLFVDGTVSAGNLNTTGGATSFGATTVSTGNLDSIATGAVTQSGVLKVGGTSTIAAAGQPITLTNTGNILTGAVNLTGAVTSVDDSVALTAHLTTSGLTNLTSEGQNLFVDGTVSNGNLNTTGGATSFGATTVAAGNLDAIATGAVTQTGAVSVSGSSVIAAGANPITLTNAGNVFTGPVSLTGGTTSLVDSVALNATILTSGVTTLNAGANALTVTGSASGPASNLNTTGGVTTFGTTSVGGNLSTVASGAVSQTGPLTVAGTSTIAAAGQPITLTNTGNILTGAVNLTGAVTSVDDSVALTAHLTTSGLTNLTSEGQNLFVDGTVSNGNLNTTGGATSFGATSVAAGNLDAIASGAVTQTGAVSVSGSSIVAAGANPITLTNAGNVFTGPVSLTGGTTSLVDSVALNATILTSGVTTLNAGANALTVTGSTTGALSNLNTTGGVTTFGTTSVGGNLSTVAGGAVTQTGPLTVAGTSTIAAAGQPITLTNTGNILTGAVNLTGAVTSVDDSVALTAHLTTSGTTNLTSEGQNLFVDGTVSAGNLNTTGGATSFGATSVSAGNLAAIATGAVTQTGALTVAGTSTIAAAGQPITLTNTGNVLTGAVNLTGAVTSVDDSVALTANLTTSGTTNLTSEGQNLTVDGTVSSGDLNTTGGATSFGATSVAAGNLDAIASGAVTQSGAVSVSGSSIVAAGANPITLTNAGNVFTGPVSLTGGTTSLVDSVALNATILTSGATTLNSGSNALSVTGSASGAASNLTTIGGATSFGTTSVGGSLLSTASGAVTQTGALTVAGTSTIAAAGQPITLTNTGNVLTGAVNLTGAVTSVDDSVALTANLTTSGTTNLTSEGQNLTVDGTVSSGDLNTTGGATSFGATSVAAGNLDAIASGAVTQSGAVSVSGSSIVAAGANPITLTNAGNVFTGPVSLTGGTTSLVDSVALNATILTSGATTLNSGSNALSVTGSASGAASNLTTIGGATSFGTTSVGGSLLSTASGAVTQTGALTVAGTSTIAAAGQPITLTNTGNVLTGAVNLTGAVTSVDDSVALTANLTTSGTTNLTSEGQNLTVDGTVSSGDLNTTGGATSFGATSVAAGNLDAIATGAVTQTGAVSVSGSSVIAAGANPITLTNAGNVFTGPVSLTGGTTSLVDSVALNATILTSGATTLNSGSNALSVTGSATGAASNLTTIGGATSFGTTSVGGSLLSTASGAVTQTGALTVAGTSTIAAAGQPITLTNTGNVLTGAVNLTGAVTSIDDSVALTANLTTSGTTNLTSEGQNLTVDGTVSSGDLNTTGGATSFGATSVAAGNLDAIATGAVTQTGAVSVSGSSVIAAGANPITLTNAGNVFTGPVSLTGGTTSLVDSVALTASIVTSGNTSLSSGTNALTVNGSTTSNLALASGPLSIGALSVGGNLTATAGGPAEITGDVAVTGNTSVTSSSFDIAAGASLTSPGAGTLLLSPNSTVEAVNIGGAASGYSVSSSTVAALSGFSNITIGRSDSTGLLTVGAGGAAFNDPTELISGSAGMAIDGALSAPSRLTLASSGAVGEGAAGVIRTPQLVIDGAGAVTLASANAVGAVAAIGSPAGLTFNNGSALTLGISGSLPVNVSGPVNISSAGTMTLAEPVTSSSSVLLVASAAGSDPGNLVINSGATVTAMAAGDAATLVSQTGEVMNADGSGAIKTPNGRWLLYAATPTGSVDDGLTGAANPSSPRIYDTSYVPGHSIAIAGDHLVFSFQPTVTITPNAQSKVYGATDPNLTFTTTGLVSADGVTDTLAIALQGQTPVFTTATGPQAVVGTFPIVPGTPVTSPIGYAVTEGSSTLTVTPATINVSTGDYSRLVNKPNPPFAVIYQGFVYNDGPGVLLTPATASTLAKPSSLPGVYAINLSGATAANYIFTYTPGKLVVVDPNSIAAVIQSVLAKEFYDCAYTYKCQEIGIPLIPHDGMLVPPNLQLLAPTLSSSNAPLDTPAARNETTGPTTAMVVSDNR